MLSYKAVFIDWDDTIGDFHGAEIASLQEIYAKYHLSNLYSSFQAYYDVYHPHNVSLWEQYGRSEVTKDELQFDRFYYPVRTMNDAKRLAVEMGNDFIRLTTEHFSVLPNATEVVRYLASKYPLTIVSNGFVEVQYEKIRLSGLQDCFSHVVLSEEVGIQKPNPLIYQKALELNGLQAKDVVMIGDNYTSDIQGAINAGIDQIWFQRLDMNPTPPDLPATYKIQDFRKILSIL